MDNISKEELVIPPYKTKEELNEWIKKNGDYISRVREHKTSKIDEEFIYILYKEIQSLTKHVDEMSILNFSEACMKIDGDLTDEIWEAGMVDRNKIIEKCLKSIIKLKKLLGTKNG
tara:strand:+ start:6187 stop:6534 length:348 start_codon:yes stop_codon:yes gene_type:complete